MKITDAAPTLGHAILAMVKGLNNTRGVQVTMNQWAAKNQNNACFGCVATLTLQEITGKTLREDFQGNSKSSLKLFSRGVGFGIDDFKELKEFEYAIDDLRCGGLLKIFDFYNIDAFKRTAIKRKFYEMFPSFHLTSEMFPTLENLPTETMRILVRLENFANWYINLEENGWC